MSNFFAEGLPFPAYVLALAYGSMGVTSVVMLVGLRLRKTKLLLSWLLLNVVTFCPEAGMVLFMTIYHWVTHFLKNSQKMAASSPGINILGNIYNIHAHLYTSY